MSRFDLEVAVANVVIAVSRVGAVGGALALLWRVLTSTVPSWAAMT